MDFYANGQLLGTATASPYTYIWNIDSTVAAGVYSLTAVATDSNNLTATSATVNVTVNSATLQAYYIHTDQLDTPRVITDGNGNAVWQWDNGDPFGANMANENPNGAGQFSFNLRFPGQYYDRETNLHYNVNRDYDPAIGRYVESDPSGLEGDDVNTYSYVGQNPVNLIDPYGLWICSPLADCSGMSKILNDALDKLERCLQLKGDLDRNKQYKVMVVTSGRDNHKTGSHANGTGADVGQGSNPGLCKNDARDCFKEAFSFGAYGQWEQNNPVYGGYHSHMQLNSKYPNRPPRYNPNTQPYSPH